MLSHSTLQTAGSVQGSDQIHRLTINAESQVRHGEEVSCLRAIPFFAAAAMFFLGARLAIDSSK